MSNKPRTEIEPGRRNPWGEPHRREGMSAVLLKPGETFEAAVDRHDRAIQAALGYFSQNALDVIDGLGVAHCWGPYHFQIIDDEGLALNIWTNKAESVWKWRVPGNFETEQGRFTDLLRAIRDLTP